MGTVTSRPASVGCALESCVVLGESSLGFAESISPVEPSGVGCPSVSVPPPAAILAPLRGVIAPAVIGSGVLPLVVPAGETADREDGSEGKHRRFHAGRLVRGAPDRPSPRRIAATEPDAEAYLPPAWRPGLRFSAQDAYGRRAAAC